MALQFQPLSLFSVVSDYDYFSMAGDQEPEQQQLDFDKSSTIPRNSDIGQSYRLMFQSKRPASTAGLPSTQAPYPGQGAYPAGPYPSTPIHSGAYPSTPAGTDCSGSDTVRNVHFNLSNFFFFLIYFCKV